MANELAHDDLHLIAENVRLHDLGNWREILFSPFWPPPYSPDLYRPLTAVLLALQFVIGGGDPLLFRIASYAMYAVAAVGVLALSMRLLPRNFALAAALLFAAHPVHVEAVALGVGQSELIVGIFATLMSLRYLDRRRANTLGARDWLYIGTLYVAASLFKEQGLLLPMLLVLIELFLVQGLFAARLRHVAAGYTALAAAGFAILLLRRAVLGGEVAGTFTAEALLGLGPAERALTMLGVVPQWARLLIWPAHLRVDYSPQEIVASAGFGSVEAFGLLMLTVALATIWLARRRAPVVAFGLAWCGVMLLPVSNVFIPTGIVLAERTLFLPSIGFVIAAVGLIAAFLPADALRQRHMVAVACGALVVAGVLRSAERHRVWRHDAYLAVRSVQDAPRSFRTQRAYGDVLFALDQPALAHEAYDRAIRFAPKGQTWRVRNDLARSLRVRGDAEREVAELRASLAEEPDQEDTRAYLVAANLALGSYGDAAREADSALARGASPDVFRGLRALADSAAQVGAPAGAIRIRINLGNARPVRP